MLIIRKITHRKNSLNRKIQLSFEVLSLCNLMIVKEFDCLCTQNFFTNFSIKQELKILHHKIKFK